MNIILILMLATGLGGRVTGADDRPVAHAVVSIVQLQSGWKRMILTNASGEYLLRQLSPGDYKIAAAKPGLKVVSTPTLTLNAGDSQQVNLHMITDITAETVALKTVVP